MFVVLAEKPSQALDYAKVLSEGHFKREKGYFDIGRSPILKEKVIVTHAVGHLVGLSSPDFYDEKYKKWSKETLPIIPNDFHYEVLKNTASQFKIVKSCLKKADKIIVATDSAREGEAIGMKIIQLSGVSKKPIFRLWANSTTKQEYIKAFENIFDESRTRPLFEEAKTREQIDWILGMNLTRYYTIKYTEDSGEREVFNVGRVQTPTLMKVIEREDEIKNFVPKKYFSLVGRLSDAITIKFTKEGENKFFNEEDMTAILNANDIHLGENNSFYVKDIKDEKKSEKPAKLYDLGAIQDVANKKWKYSLEDTLTSIQILYEKYKVLSYPRTESQYIGEGEFNQLKDHFEDYCKILNFNGVLENTKSRKEYVDQSKVTDHYALIPTEVIPTKKDLDSMNEMEKNIYIEVLKHTISIFLKDYIYSQKTIIVEKNDLTFKTSASVPIDMGFKALSDEHSKEEIPSVNKLEQLNFLEKNEVVNFKVSAEEKFTTVPKRYTQATLGGRSSLMTKYSLGTPATKTGIVKNLVSHDYLIEKKNYLYPTPKAYKLRDLIGDSLVGEVELTSYMEDSLKAIGESKSNNTYIMGLITELVKNTVKGE